MALEDACACQKIWRLRTDDHQGRRWVPRGIPLIVTLTTAISAPAQIVNGDASMGQQLAQKWCSDCHAVGAEDAEAYVPSFVLIAEMCFSIGGLNWRRLQCEICSPCRPAG